MPDQKDAWFRRMRRLDVIIGKIVKSTSHINYVCQIYGPLEIETLPNVVDYAFGHFVRVVISSRCSDLACQRQERDQSLNEESSCYVVGVIYDTQLLNPAFGSLGPRLSNETQVELFSPDYLSEKAVLIYVMILGMLELRRTPAGTSEFLSVMHGVPLLSLELGSEIETMADEEVQAFHFFHDTANGPDAQNA